MEWETFDRRTAPVGNDQPIVSIQKRGTFGFNRAAYDALCCPPALTLMYSPKARAIGFKPAEPSDPRAYPVRRQSAGSNFQTAGKAFLAYHGLPIPDYSHRYIAEVVDGILVVDLNQEGEEQDTSEEAHSLETAS